MFLGDGSYFPNLATGAHLTGSQWGVMNETGNTPGQSWLWLFSFFYQIQPFASSPNADILVVSIMLALSLALTLLPFIPGLRATAPQESPSIASSGGTTTATAEKNTHVHISAPYYQPPHQRTPRHQHHPAA